MKSQLQHYVPRFVLRRFTTVPKDTVHVYDKQNDRSFVAGTGKVAAENGLYDFEFDGEALTGEPGLAEMEGRAARHVNRILRDERLDRQNRLERDELARFFAVQFVRTPAHRQMWREFSTRMQTWLRKEGMREDFFEVDPRLGSRENAEREFIAENLADAPHRFGPAFVAKDWVLMKTDSPSLYFIGDHPLVMYNSLDFALHGNLGLTVQGVEIYFPLSPNLALGMMCASHAREFREGLQRMSQSDLSDPGRQKGISVARDFIRAVESGEPALMDPENVDFLNSLQIARSERFLFSHDGNFALAEKMIADHPQARHGARIEEATGKF